MRIHFALFKRATWLSERVQPDSDEEDDLSFVLATRQVAHNAPLCSHVDWADVAEAH